MGNHLTDKHHRRRAATTRTTPNVTGHKVTREGIFLDETKSEAIKNFKIPVNRKGVRSFLGLTGYYRKFIKDYGSIAAPLPKLTSINVEFKWENQHQIAFEKLKELLINPPVLIYPIFSEEFILTNEARCVGIGAVVTFVVVLVVGARR